MQQSEIEGARSRLQDLARELLPEGAVSEVALLQYGEDPAVEPGQIIVRVLLPDPGPADAQGAREPGAARGPDSDPLDVLRRKHQAALEQFRDTIDREIPGVSFIEFTADRDSEHRARMRWRVGHRADGPPGELTPVMARLAPTDLQTLDTLITTGIAANRADAVRWALARIRERPAYAELRERAQQIQELKTRL